MNILLTGGTGFIGSLLLPTLLGPSALGGGHRVTVLSRRPAKFSLRHQEAIACAQLRVIGTLDELTRDDVYDAVINLAGEGIADRPWTAQRKRELHDSRITLTEALVDWMRRARQKPKVLISGSAIGWYGSQGDKVLEEGALPHVEYVHELCQAWEKAAASAETHGLRVCLLRTGVVVGAGGGFLRKLLPLFGLGLAGPLGSGQQYLSWISLTDVVQIILRLLNDPELHGAFNVTGPRPVTNTEFTQTLARLLRRPAFLRLPASVLKLAMGEMSTLLLDGQRVIPSRLLQAGYTFQHASLEDALRSALHQQRHGNAD
ncbi:MAG: TIGR01777 family oxidoreductase [Pseudomonadota bacterium]